MKSSMEFHDSLISMKMYVQLHFTFKILVYPFFLKKLEYTDHVWFEKQLPAHRRSEIKKHDLI